MTRSRDTSFERSRIHGVSNLSAYSDGIRVLRTILYERSIVPHRGQRFQYPASRSALSSASGEPDDPPLEPNLYDIGAEPTAQRRSKSRPPSASSGHRRGVRE